MRRLAGLGRGQRITPSAVGSFAVFVLYLIGVLSAIVGLENGWVVAGGCLVSVVVAAFIVVRAGIVLPPIASILLLAGSLIFGLPKL